MGGNKPFSALAILTVLGVLDSTCFAAMRDDSMDDDRVVRAVTPCKLVGVNPAAHPEIFGNPAVAKLYGFVRARDGTWHVGAGCGAPASAYAPHPESPKATRQRSR